MIAASAGDDGSTSLARCRSRRARSPALRHLPLAGEAREVDRAWRPVYAVWELTLKCDLACGHCGSRAGRPRPDELDTAACLDLVAQMAALGVVEVDGDRRRGLPARRLVDDRAGDPRRRHAVLDDDRRPRRHRRARPRRRRSRFAERQRLDRRQRGDARPAARRRGGAPVRAGGGRSPEGGRHRPGGQHADQPVCRCASSPTCWRRSSPSARAPGRSSSPSRWAARATSPTCCCSRKISWSSSRCW